MHRFNEYNLVIESFSEIRILRESAVDLDLIVDLNQRVVNLYLDNFPDYILDRLQFTEVKSLIIRISKDKEDNNATVHLLRSIDLNTSLLNFSINYEKIKLILFNKKYNIDFLIKNTSQNLIESLDNE